MMTLQQIEALTMQDVERARAKLARQRAASPEDRDRSGSSTIDFTLMGVTGSPGHTLEDAKAYLRSRVVPEFSAAEFKRLVLQLGLAFHPDTRGCDYVNEDGSRTFSEREAAHYDAVMAAAFAHPALDPYEMGLEVWIEAGLIP